MTSFFVTIKNEINNPMYFPSNFWNNMYFSATQYKRKIKKEEEGKSNLSLFNRQR